MGFDGTLKFDTTIDKTGFKLGLDGLGNIAKIGMDAIGSAVSAAAGAMVNLGKEALNAYADYEQLVGGVETLFGAQGMELEYYARSVGKSVDAARSEYDKLISAQNTVLENASQAFRTAGLSQNEYMETVTSFSAALISSLGGDTAKAAEVADLAIVDMADNANKMGSSMESIQTAYQGFAKQNYTMLDNLKLGYGGTKTEMERLLANAQAISGIEYNIDSYADVVNAIHVVQTQMGITGATREEAEETISGSLAMLGAAWDNLTVGFAVECLSEIANNFTASLPIIINSGKTIILTLAQIIAENVPKIAEIALNVIIEFSQSLMKNLPMLLVSALTIVNGLANSIISNLPLFIKCAETLLTEFAGAISENIPRILNSATVIIQKLSGAILENLPVLTETALKIIQELANAISESIPLILNSATTIIHEISAAILENVPLLADAALTIIQSLSEVIINNIPLFIEMASQIVSELVNFLTEGTPVILDAAIKLFMGIVDAIPEILDKISSEFPKIINEISNEI